MNSNYGRNELKYVVSTSKAKLIDFKMSSILEKDHFVNNFGFYGIKSMYFDDDEYSNAYDVEQGNYIKKKYRIRRYIANNKQQLYLECKRKKGTICYKEKAAINLDEYHKIINGDYDDFVFTGNELLKKFIIDKTIKNLSPKIIIQYDRIPYVEDITNTRITIDRNIRASLSLDNFLDDDANGFPIQGDGSMLLEVKYDEFLPGYINDLLAISDVPQISFSKYYLGFQHFKEGL